MPSQNTASDIGGRSAGLKTRSVPMRASKYSLKASTPTTASTTPARPLQKSVRVERIARWRRPRPRRAGRAAAPRRGRSGSAPSRRRAAGAATPTGRAPAGRSAQRLRDGPIGAACASCRGRRRARRRTARRAGRATRGGSSPRSGRAVSRRKSPQTNGKRVDELDEAVGQHDQQAPPDAAGDSAAPRAAPPRGSRRACGPRTRSVLARSASKNASYCSSVTSRWRQALTALPVYIVRPV